MECFLGLVRMACGEDKEIIEVFRNVFRRVISSCLGGSVVEAVLFLLRERLRRDPFEVLWDDPKAFYSEMFRVFGDGAKVLVSVLVVGINNKYGLREDPSRLLEVMRSGQGSPDYVRSFMRRVAEVAGGE